MNAQRILDLFRGYYAVSKEKGIRRVIHAAQLVRQCEKDNELLAASTFAELERLQIENEKIRCWIRDLMIEADRAADALRQKKRICYRHCIAAFGFVCKRNGVVNVNATF